MPPLPANARHPPPLAKTNVQPDKLFPSWEIYQNRTPGATFPDYLALFWKAYRDSYEFLKALPRGTVVQELAFVAMVMSCPKAQEHGWSHHLNLIVWISLFKKEGEPEANWEEAKRNFDRAFFAADTMEDPRPLQRLAERASTLSTVLRALQIHRHHRIGGNVSADNIDKDTEVFVTGPMSFNLVKTDPKFYAEAQRQDIWNLMQAFFQHATRDPTHHEQVKNRVTNEWAQRTISVYWKETDGSEKSKEDFRVPETVLKGLFDCKDAMEMFRLYDITLVRASPLKIPDRLQAWLNLLAWRKILQDANWYYPRIPTVPPPVRLSLGGAELESSLFSSHKMSVVSDSESDVPSLSAASPTPSWDDPNDSDDGPRTPRPFVDSRPHPPPPPHIRGQPYRELGKGRHPSTSPPLASHFEEHELSRRAARIYGRRFANWRAAFLDD